MLPSMKRARRSKNKHEEGRQRGEGHVAVMMRLQDLVHTTNPIRHVLNLRSCNAFKKRQRFQLLSGALSQVALTGAKTSTVEGAPVGETCVERREQGQAKGRGSRISGDIQQISWRHVLNLRSCYAFKKQQRFSYSVALTLREPSDDPRHRHAPSASHSEGK